ncbi:MULTISPECIES: hypothetical protein [Falsihalocynthiibacter]|uniref:hypothetical protein n=1 Tax=Falsihalocynthiibacter TaxID=2854182 RepID=UPI0030037326
MNEPSRPLFVAHATYRARRTMDAARLLPLLGVILLVGVLTLIRSNASDDGISGSVLFMFGVWVVLIALAALLARPLHRIGRKEYKASKSDHEA